MSELQAELAEAGVAVEEPAVALFHAGVGGAGDVGGGEGGGVGGVEPGCAAGGCGVEVWVGEVDWLVVC